MTSAEGWFDVETVVPGPYTIPLGRPCGELCRAAGWSPWRPGHLHLLVDAPGHERLTTQLFFAGEDYLDNDVAAAVKPFILDLVAEPDGTPGQQLYTASYDFVLEPASSCPRARSPSPCIRRWPTCRWCIPTGSATP